MISFVGMIHPDSGLIIGCLTGQDDLGYWVFGYWVVGIGYLDNWVLGIWVLGGSGSLGIG